MTALKAAALYGVRPSAMVLGRDNRKRWGKWDILLAKAYQRYLDEQCPQCGMPIYICHSEDNRIEFKAVKDVCFAAAEVDRAQKRAADGRRKDQSPEPGMRFIPEPKFVPGEGDEDVELSDLRLPYFRDLAVRRGLVPPVDSES